jgi:hypothetical protein
MGAADRGSTGYALRGWAAAASSDSSSTNSRIRLNTASGCSAAKPCTAPAKRRKCSRSGSELFGIFDRHTRVELAREQRSNVSSTRSTWTCRRARENEPGGMVGMSESAVEGDEATERGAEDDRLLDPERLAESPQVIGPLV